MYYGLLRLKYYLSLLIYDIILIMYDILKVDIWFNWFFGVEKSFFYDLVWKRIVFDEGNWFIFGVVCY